jgi:hypothetical protein
MPVHIQQRRREQFAHVVAFIKLRRAEHAVAQRSPASLPRFDNAAHSGQIPAARWPSVHKSATETQQNRAAYWFPTGWHTSGWQTGRAGYAKFVE